MFPRIVTIAPGEGARRRQVPPSSTIPRASHPSTTTSPLLPRSQLLCVFRSSNRWSSDEKERLWTMDVHFLPAFPFFLSFPSFSLALLFSTRVWFPRLLFSVLLFFPFPHPSLPFFSPTSKNFQERLRISGRSATRFLRSFPTGASTGIVGLYTGSKSHKTVRDTTLLRVRFIHDAVPCVA